MEAGSKLPQDLVYEILVRLPIKSIYQFKRVCKSWNSLFSSHEFAKSHSRLSKRNHNLLIVLEQDCSRSCYSLSSNVIHNEYASCVKLEVPVCLKDNACCCVIFVGSCDGLICLQYFDVWLEHQYLILNPTIRECKTLPIIQNLLDGHEYFHEGYGFGYDQVSDDYKMIAKATSKGSVKVYTFSMRTNSWKIIEHANDVPTGCLSTYVDGILYGVRWSRECDPSIEPYDIIAYDLTDDKFSVVYSSPPLKSCEPVSCISKVNLASLNGLLCAMEFQTDGGFTSFKIFRKEKSELSIKKIFKIPIIGINLTVAPLFYILVVQTRSYHDGGILLQVLDRSYEHRLVWYKPQENIIKDVKIDILDSSNGELHQVTMYQESMISPFCYDAPCGQEE